MMIPDHTAARNGPRAPGRDIIVIGASAGGVDALQRLVAGLPPELPAAIFVVIHQPPWHRSELPSILSSKSPLQYFNEKHNISALFTATP